MNLCFTLSLDRNYKFNLSFINKQQNLKKDHKQFVHFISKLHFAKFAAIETS